MKRAFGFTQARFVLSVCHANAKHPKSRPTEAPRSHSYHPQFPRTRGKPPSDYPACGGSPLLIPPRAGERKGAVTLSEAKHLKSRPTKTLRSHPTSCLSAPAALQSGRAQGRFANRPCCASVPNDGVGRMLVSPLCASCWSRQAYKLGAFMDRGRTLWVGDGSAVAHPL